MGMRSRGHRVANGVLQGLWHEQGAQNGVIPGYLKINGPKSSIATLRATLIQGTFIHKVTLKPSSAAFPKPPSRSPKTLNLTEAHSLTSLPFERSAADLAVTSAPDSGFGVFGVHCLGFTTV